MPNSTDTAALPEPGIRRFASPLAAGFLAEWERLRASASVHHRVAAWELPGGPVEVSERRALDDVLARTGFLAERCEDGGDQALLALVRLAAHDDLAARVVLQRILPALVAVARRRGPIAGGPQAAFEELVATAWIAIRTYPVERRPRKVAANLVRDAEYGAFVRPQRLRSADERVGLPAHALQTEAALDGGPVGRRPDPGTEVAELLATADPARFDEQDRAFVQAFLEGADTVGLATRFAVSERTVRNRRRQVASRLRQATLGAAA